MITVSDIAIVATFIKNSEGVWTAPPSPGEEVKPLFTIGSTTKRQFGGTAMNKAGITYYNKCCKAWAATKSDTSCHEQFLTDWNDFVTTSPGFKYLQGKKTRQYAAGATAATEAPLIHLWDEDDEDKEVVYTGEEEEEGLDDEEARLDDEESRLDDEDGSGDDDNDEEGEVHEKELRNQIEIPQVRKNLKRSAHSTHAQSSDEKSGDHNEGKQNEKKKKGNRK
jgi:hypothetical protein